MNRRAVLVAIIGAMIQGPKRKQIKADFSKEPTLAAPCETVGLAFMMTTKGISKSCEVYALIIRIDDREVRYTPSELMDILENKTWLDRMLDKLRSL